MIPTCKTLNVSFNTDLFLFIIEWEVKGIMKVSSKHNKFPSTPLSRDKIMCVLDKQVVKFEYCLLDLL